MAGQPQQIQTEGEKSPTHKPVVTKTDTGIKVDVGEVPHGMDESHYIDWIEVETADGNVTRKDLSSTDAPQATFEISNPTKVRSSCTTHGIWETQV